MYMCVPCQVVTQDASSEAGAAPKCRSNVQRTFEAIFAMGKSQNGLDQLSEAFATCHKLQKGQSKDLAYWIQVQLALISDTDAANDGLVKHVPGGQAGCSCWHCMTDRQSQPWTADADILGPEFIFTLVASSALQ